MKFLLSNDAAAFVLPQRHEAFILDKLDKLIQI